MLFAHDAAGIGVVGSYGEPSLHALDGGNATGRILNILFLVNTAFGTDNLFDPNSDVVEGSDTALTPSLGVRQIRWISSSRQIILGRFPEDTGQMSAFWNNIVNPLRETKDLYFLSELDGLIKIDSEWADTIGDTFSRWVIPEGEGAVEALNNLVDGQHCLFTVVDEDTLSDLPYVLGYEEGFYLKLKVGDTEELKWLRPASYSPGFWHWTSQWEKASSPPTVVGTGYTAGIYDIEGQSQYIAADPVTVHGELARKDETTLPFAMYRHHNMDNQFELYTPYDVYPDSRDDGLVGRRNIILTRKFVFGRVEGSNNGGLPIAEIDIRSGDRGNVDYDAGEAIGSDLLPLTMIRPAKGMWRFTVDINALTHKKNEVISIAILRENTYENFLVSARYTRIGTGVGDITPRDMDIDSDGQAYFIAEDVDAVFGLDLSTGVGTRVGLVVNFGVGESSARGLAWDGTDWFLVGALNEVLYRYDPTTARCTQVGATAAGFGVNEGSPNSLAATDDGSLYMVGGALDALLLMDKVDGSASRVGVLRNFGLPATVTFTTSRLFAIGNRLFMEASGNIYEIDRITGTATLLGSSNQGFTGLSYYQGLIYGISAFETSYVLHRSNVLDLPVSVSEGIGTPVVSRYNFPGYQRAADYSVSAKLIGGPIYCDGETDYTIVWHLAPITELIDEIEPDDDVQAWLARDCRVFIERLD